MESKVSLLVAEDTSDERRKSKVENSPSTLAVLGKKS
jgi:hypothetical protein